MADEDSHLSDSSVSADLRQVSFFLPNMFTDASFPHTIDNVGKHFEFGVLNTFSRYWNTKIFWFLATFEQLSLQKVTKSNF